MILGIDESVMLDKHKIKVVDGVAGCGKSSLLDAFFKSQGMSYKRFTSTNALKRDAEERYNIECNTIAAGMFVNEFGKFYSKFKEPTYTNVVIDEILQTSPRALDWCNEFVGDCNIIITTDSNQLLAPENEQNMSQAFKALIEQTNVVYSCIDKTKRARDEETEQMFEQFYELSNSPLLYNVSKLSAMFPTLSYKDISYNTKDVYITHSKAIEDYLYKDETLSTRSDLDLIQKGSIASKRNIDLSKYAILSQYEAERTNARAYTQIKNIGTPTRYQGSEVIEGSKLYFMVTPNSLVSARELYTVVTRVWFKSSIYIVVVDDVPEVSEIKQFNGLPVKHLATAKCDYDGDTKILNNKKMDKLFSEQFPDTDEIFYDKTIIYGKNGVAYLREGCDIPTFDNKYRYKVSAGSLARKDGALNYSYMPTIYRELEKLGLDKVNAPRLRRRNNNKCDYEVDLYSAYPTILKFEDLPADGLIRFEKSDELMNFYLVKSDILTREGIIEDKLANYIVDNNLGEVKYLFSVPKMRGCYPGEYLYNMANKSKESKKSIKDIHYGYYERRYLKLAYDESCYIINERDKYELLFACIMSNINYYMLKVSEVVDGNKFVIDSVHFNNYDDSLIEKVAKALPSWIKWRIMEEGGDKEAPLACNYELPNTRNKILAAQQKNRRANMTEEQKEAIRAKDRERKRRKKEEKARTSV